MVLLSQVIDLRLIPQEAMSLCMCTSLIVQGKTVSLGYGHGLCPETSNRVDGAELTHCPSLYIQ